MSASSRWMYSFRLKRWMSSGTTRWIVFSGSSRSMLRIRLAYSFLRLISSMDSPMMIL